MGYPIPKNPISEKSPILGIKISRFNYILDSRYKSPQIFENALSPLIKIPQFLNILNSRDIKIYQILKKSPIPGIKIPRF